MDGSTHTSNDADLPRRCAEVEQRIDYQFQNKELLVLALTHPSYTNENAATIAADNQRLEFLGDAVLGLVIAWRLFDKHTELPEGRLTRLKAAIVCEETLASVALGLQLGDYLLLGRGERASDGHEKPSILADALEALLASVYLDGGFEEATRVISAIFERHIEKAPIVARAFDAKTVLQERMQAHGPKRPRYEVVSFSGPPHERIYTIAVHLGDSISAEGTGRSKKEAQKQAAAAALALLDDLED